MKRCLFNLLFLLFALSIYGQEKASPLYGEELERSVAHIIIERDYYENVVVKLKSSSELSLIDKVKVEVVDSIGKTIYKKTFKNAYLYVFSSGQVQVGRNNFNKLIISKKYLTVKGDYICTCMIKEKEGIY